MNPAGPRILSNRRKALVLLIALTSDVVSTFTGHLPWIALEWLVDGVTALLLFSLLGFHWQLLPALLAEAVPEVALFPTWTAAVVWIVGTSGSRASQPPQAGR
ncbi:MAG: hypothetical protein ABI054_07865 [Planctomycetota bacterium]